MLQSQSLQKLNVSNLISKTLNTFQALETSCDIKTAVGEIYFARRPLLDQSETINVRGSDPLWQTVILLNLVEKGSRVATKTLPRE